jgi:hypothetical protein
VRLSFVPSSILSPRPMIALAMLFGFCIWINGSTFAAIHGRWAQRLELPGSALIPFVPGLALAAYVLAVIAIHRFKTPWKRWLSFVVATLLGNLVIGYPKELLDRESIRIPVASSLNRESQQSFEARYPVKWVGYSSSSDGTCIRVPKDHHSPELAAFVTDLAAHQAGSSRDTGP